MPDADQPPYRLDRTAFSVGRVDEPSDEGACWRSKTPQERIRALCYLRWIAYGDAAFGPLQRALTVARLGDDD